MNQQDKNPSFFDPKTLIAVGAVALIYFGWQTYLGKKYPNYNKPKTEQAQQVAGETAAATPEASATATEAKPVDAKSETVAPAAEQKFTFSNDKVSFVISNHGMGLQDYTVNNYEDKKGNKIKLGAGDGLFSMRLAGAAEARKLQQPVS
ncbi:MAG: membrane protein insertase YidC, partial [Bdellovibrio sp.]|nr:membrane protein insertase YidC [Bdellovibrio sp.]